MFPAQGVQGAQADRPVFLKILKELEQAVLPQHHTLMLPQQCHSLLVEHPAHCVVDILKVVVKMLPSHAAGLHDFHDGNFHSEAFVPSKFSVRRRSPAWPPRWLRMFAVSSQRPQTFPRILDFILAQIPGLIIDAD